MMSPRCDKDDTMMSSRCPQDETMMFPCCEDAMLTHHSLEVSLLVFLALEEVDTG